MKIVEDELVDSIEDLIEGGMGSCQTGTTFYEEEYCHSQAVARYIIDGFPELSFRLCPEHTKQMRDYLDEYKEELESAVQYVCYFCDRPKHTLRLARRFENLERATAVTPMFEIDDQILCDTCVEEYKEEEVEELKETIAKKQARIEHEKHKLDEELDPV
jgi:dTDP-D-glucose 4,6-dehydratase